VSFLLAPTGNLDLLVMELAGFLLQTSTTSLGKDEEQIRTDAFEVY
jgi:hypothetical protein